MPFSKKNDYVVIVGSSNMDLNIYIERFPAPGETITGGIFRQFLGGKGANQAVASIRNGASTTFLGRIGMDMFGDQMVEQLSSEGIDTSRIIRDPEEMSGVAFILIDAKGENMISVAPGANKKLSVSDIMKNADLIEQAKVVMAQMEIPLTTLETVFEIAARGEAIKILNPAPLKPFPIDLLKNVDIITPNKGELLRLHVLFNLGEIPRDKDEQIIESSKNISKLGLNTIITTLGHEGSLMFDKEMGIYSIKSFPVKAVDTVGAGDCFNGVLASRICQGKNLLEAIKYATAAASIAVTRKGAQASMPYSNEVEKNYEQFSDDMIKKW
ncbi:MAG: ribokinase [Promethearchaeota archaeon]